MTSEFKAKAIREVLDQLDAIIDDSARNNNPSAIFSYVYRRTTAQIEQAVQNKEFEDNEGMERFDVLFASKYLEAYHQYESGIPCSNPWKVAFDACKEKHIILQHILLGMNAHINYDLGISADEHCAGKIIQNFKKDFMKVNDILASLTDELQSKLGRVSRLMFLLDWIGKRTDENMINFSMVKAREQAWNFAVNLASSDDVGKSVRMENTANFTAGLGDLVLNPPGRLVFFVLRLISGFEEKDIRKIIKKLEK
jgi:hypothetical protein